MRFRTTPIRTRLALALGLVLAAGQAGAADLMSVYQQARQSDPQLQAAEARKFAEGERVVQARSALLPQVAGSASWNDSDGTSSFGAPRPFERPDGSFGFGPTTNESDDNTRRYSVTLRQSLYDHANYTRLDAARALRSQGEADYDTALDGLFIRVATAYFDALTATTNLDAARAEEKAVGRQLEQAEQRFEVGLTAITDVHEARARYDSARANVILSQNQLDDAYEALQELTGEPVDTLEAVSADIPMALPEPNDPEQWVQVALDQSPALASRRFALDAAEANLRTAKAGHFPTLGLEASRSTSDSWGVSLSNDNPSSARSSSFGNSVSVVLNVPIFEGFATQSGVRQGVNNRDAAADQFEQEKRGIVRAVRSAYRAVVAGMSEIEARKQALVSAQSALEATQAGFEVGTRTIVDVLLSQQQLFAAQREYARARHTFIVAGLRLKQSAGVIDVADIEVVNGLLTEVVPAAETTSQDSQG
ncbi:MAG: TolC family outer membrane protein [Xanthomonadaceae bacterium]|jgi:outer membrane protein|nr:TolC family outer membrane protein [Xanthomonadaceae bacterium]